MSAVVWYEIRGARCGEPMLFQCEYVICTSLVNCQPKMEPESTHGLRVKDAREELEIFRNFLLFSLYCAEDGESLIDFYGGECLPSAAAVAFCMRETSKNQSSNENATR